MEKLASDHGAIPIPARDSSIVSNSGGSGVCMMSNVWRDKQHPSFIRYISSFLSANSFRLNFVPIAPDFIFNCGGLSVAFIFVTSWDCISKPPIFSRVQKLKGQFGNLYVIVTLPTAEQNDSFFRSYFKYGMEIGKPTFVPVQDLEMGFEKIVKIAHARGGDYLVGGFLTEFSTKLKCIMKKILLNQVTLNNAHATNRAVFKQHDVISKLKAEREKAVQSMDAYLSVITSIPQIDNHDANALNQAVGSIEQISKASKDQILEKTDLSAEKAETITMFFKDPQYYMSPKIY